MFYAAKDAVAFATSPDLPKTMGNVAQFSFDHGLLGEGAPDAGFIGIALPDGKVLGNADNVKLRFDAEYMGLAADGKL
jgi:NitT/TauT family transport system substrate-binding protein